MSPLTEPTRLTLAKGQPVPNDPSFAFTSLLLHGDGVNGSTVIRDTSSSPKTVTAFGTAQISTAQSKFGGSSILFSGLASDYLTIPNEDFFFGSGNFTIELWYYPLGSGNRGIVGNYLNNGFEMYQDASGKILIDLVISGVEKFKLGLTPLANSAWSHVAFVRNATDLLLYINGSLDGSLASVSGSQDRPSAPLRVGSARSSVNASGYIDELRITKGVARYTSNFTPPTAPFPDF